MSGSSPNAKPKRFPLSLNQVAAGARATPGREVLRPQAPLHQAEQHRRQMAAPNATPSGLGMDSRAVQQRMVERLHADGIRHPALLQAFRTIPRHWFVDSALVNQAYEDTSLPIGLGQTISKPSVIGSMIELLCQRPGLSPDTPMPLGSCLDIGTGCGYQAAILSCLARRVVSIERLRDLHLKARQNLDRLRQGLPQWQDVRLVYADGMLGHGPNAPYDTIIAAAGGSAVPSAWLDQLAPGGRLVAPMEDSRTGQQMLNIIDRLSNGQLQQVVAGPVLFVPLKSGTT
ncbi:MAG TPA: protein-L-isoaspartate O-methyltransferase [Aquabacterium sp.]|nr:protein-L-isoaspartate O-methyltransferase [Aquabacterium sp.]